MKTFTEYLTEAVTKTPSLRKFGKELVSTLNNVKGFEVVGETFTDYDYETFTFRMRETRDFYTGTNELSDEQKKDLLDRAKKLIKNVSLVVGVKTLPRLAEKTGVSLKGKLMNVWSYEDAKTKEGFLASMRVEAVYAAEFSGYNGITIYVALKGKKAKESDAEFETYKKVVPGAIFYDSFGYNATHVTFYQVVKRIKDQVWVKELQSSKTGGGYYGNTTPLKDKFADNETYKGRIDKSYSENEPGLRVRTDLHLTSLFYWKGKPMYYNTMD